MGSRLIHFLWLIFLLLSITEVQSLTRVFNINSYGAIADGKTNNYRALLTAWNKGCRSRGGGMVLVPRGTYLVSSLVLTGNCHGQMVFMLQGFLIAPSYQQFRRNSDHWISFRYINDLIITGGGGFDGQGPTAWSHNNCITNPNCDQLPVALRLDFVSKAHVSYVRLMNSMNFHMNIFSCHDIKLDHIHIISPGNSPNTDGIHLGDSTGIRITNSIISTGDDCISFGSGMSDVEVNNVHCGPGHGISIGSLGKYPNEHDVSGFVIKNCNFSGTQNGVRIKTWALASQVPIKVYNLTFDHINMYNVNNPIIIDQEYCPSNNCPPKSSSQIQVRDVKFRNIQGTSSSKLAVTLRCSRSKPCQEIELRDISLRYHGSDGHETSQCSFASGASYGFQQPRSCL